MSATPDSTADLTRYLLGQLTEQEASALEERYFVDDELFARVEVAADDLSARYLKGTLSPDERVRFQKHLLGSRDDRLRLRVTRALESYIAAKGAAVVPPPSRHRAWSLTGIARFATAAAGVALVAGVGVLSWRVAGLQSEVTSLQASIAAAQERERAERAQRESAEQRLADAQTAAFVVVPGTERGGGSVLLVPAAAAFARFDLALERPLSGRCRVTVRTADRAVVWSRDLDVPPGASSVTVTVPGSLLGSGQYEAVLASITPAGAPTEVAVYGLTLSRR